MSEPNVAMLPVFSVDDLDVLACFVSDAETSTQVKTVDDTDTDTPVKFDMLPLRKPLVDGSAKPKRFVRSPDERRRRRLRREQDRVKKVKRGIEELRRDVESLQRTLAEQMRAIALRRELTPSMETYIHAVTSGGHLYDLREWQDEELQRRQTRALTVKLLAAHGCQFRIADKSETSSIQMNPLTLFELMLAQEPLSLREADAFVAHSCLEMDESLAQADWADSVHQLCEGLSGGGRVVGPLLEFQLAKWLEGVTAQTIADKTWTLLTKLDQYRRIQPQTTQLRVLQRVSDRLWVIGFQVGERHSLVLVGRAPVTSGFVITFRSLPLTRTGSGNASASAWQDFIKSESESKTGGIHVSTFSWYRFQEQSRATGDGVDCHVTFGDTARNLDPGYLSQLQLEVVAGFARWHAAIGFPHVLFKEPLVNSEV